MVIFAGLGFWAYELADYPPMRLCGARIAEREERGIIKGGFQTISEKGSLFFPGNHSSPKELRCATNSVNLCLLVFIQGEPQ